MRKEIALKTFRSYGCISKQVESIAEKLQAHSSTEIVAIAIAECLVEIQLIKPEHHILLNSVLALLMIGQLYSPMGRRPPSPPSFRIMRIRTEFH